MINFYLIPSAFQKLLFAKELSVSGAHRVHLSLAGLLVVLLVVLVGAAALLVVLLVVDRKLANFTGWFT